MKKERKRKIKNRERQMIESKHLGIDVTLENLSSDDEDSRIRRVALRD